VVCVWCVCGCVVCACVMCVCGVCGVCVCGVCLCVCVWCVCVCVLCVRVWCVCQSHTMQPLFVCGYRVEDGVTTFCISAALCQAELPGWYHLNQSCRTCVRFLLLPMKGDLDDNIFMKVWIWTVLWNLRRPIYFYLLVLSKFRDVTTSYS